MSETEVQSGQRPVRARVRARDVLLLGITGALVAALGSVLIDQVPVRLMGRRSDPGADFVFLAPVGFLIIFLFPALPLAVGTRFVPFVGRIAPFVFGALASWALLLFLESIHPIAILIMALGVGTQVHRWWVAVPGRGSRVAARIASACAAALFVVAAVTWAERWLTGARLSREQGPAPAEAPNVLLLILDTVRAANLSVYGYSRPTTPNLERLAGSGVAFEHAYSVSSWSAPAHASMMTGLWGSETRADYRRRMVDTVPTLAATLNRFGYATGAFMSNGDFAGRALGISRGFSTFEDWPFTIRHAVDGTTLTSTGFGLMVLRAVRARKLWILLNAFRNPDIRFTGYWFPKAGAEEVVPEFWKWRDQVSSERPWFAMLNFMDAHEPYTPKGSFTSAFGSGTSDLDRYDRAIAWLDSIVGAMHSELSRRGEADRTVIVVTSDHGEQWGEHGLKGHRNSVYLPVMHVPLIFSGGSVPAGVRFSPVVSMRDLAATILDLTGNSNHRLRGTSLRHAWTSGSNEGVSPVILEATAGVNSPPTELIAPGTIRSMLDSSWHFIRYGDGREELFAWRSDSAELNNVITSAEGRAAADRLLELIKSQLGPTFTAVR
ncbi:MAG: sulfatase [Gemmatimonadota bacterium]